MCHSSGTEMFQANNEESKILYPVPAVTSRRIHSTVIQSAQTHVFYSLLCVLIFSDDVSGYPSTPLTPCICCFLLMKPVTFP